MLIVIIRINRMMAGSGERQTASQARDGRERHGAVQAGEAVEKGIAEAVRHTAIKHSKLCITSKGETLHSVHSLRGEQAETDTERVEHGAA